LVDWTGAYIAALPGDIVRKFLVCDELLKVPAVLLHVVHAHLTGQFVHLLVAVDLICNGPEHAVAVALNRLHSQPARLKRLLEAPFVLWALRLGLLGAR
jgi:hypothetical protein